jgi:hypothetical protein
MMNTYLIQYVLVEFIGIIFVAVIICANIRLEVEGVFFFFFEEQNV